MLASFVSNRYLTLAETVSIFQPPVFSNSDLVGLLYFSVLDHFGTDQTEYSVIFTSGATSAIKLVAECFDYGRDGTLCYLDDNHTSVLGARRYALQRGVKVKCITEDQLLNTTATQGVSIAPVFCKIFG